MDTVTCPHCGTTNQAGSALCSNCQSPLTAYAGQLQGERYQGKLAHQVEGLDRRPYSVIAMTVYLGLATLIFPLRWIFEAFARREHLNSDATNYAAAAFGSVGPVLVSIACVPIAAVLVWCAWAACTQRPVAWKACLGAAAILSAFSIIQFPAHHVLSSLVLLVSIALCFVWTRSGVRAWFGLT